MSHCFHVYGIAPVAAWQIVRECMYTKNLELMFRTLKRQSTETLNIWYFSVRTLNGSVEDVFDPKFRKVDYGSAPYVVLVSTHLRYAWWALPGEDTRDDGIGKFNKANRGVPEEERERVPQNPDGESLRIPWRDSIYHLWNHVFHDVMNFLPEVNCSVGYFHPPSHDAFALDCSSSEDENVAVGKKRWNTNVLLIPAHRTPDVSVRATVDESHEEGTSEKELGRFDASNLTEIWYVRKGVHVNFFIEGDLKTNPQGVAAVNSLRYPVLRYS